ncbi:hypothetical protein EDC01DRAFT_791254 [Geopyxis carbonaria]|nr:hypothetical protein EDC01DRAFT_791254 [Geopyxis carbonaria]
MATPRIHYTDSDSGRSGTPSPKLAAEPQAPLLLPEIPPLDSAVAAADADSDDSADADAVAVVEHLQCDVCEKTYTDRAAWEVHRRRKHLFCKECSMAFKDYRAMNYHLAYSKRHIVCGMCFIEFKSAAGLKVHVRQFHREQLEIFCPGCQQQFPFQSAVVQHIEGNDCEGISRTDFHHRMVADVFPDSAAPLDNTTDIPGLDKMYKVKPAPTTRMNPSTGQRLLAGLVPTDDSAKERPAILRTNWTREEEVARDRAKNKHRLETMISHWDEIQQAFVCPNSRCRKKFRDRRAGPMSLLQHLNSATHDPHNYACHACGKYFLTSACVLQHVESGLCGKKSTIPQVTLTQQQADRHAAVLEDMRTKAAMTSTDMGWACPDEDEEETRHAASNIPPPSNPTDGEFGGACPPSPMRNWQDRRFTPGYGTGKMRDDGPYYDEHGRRRKKSESDDDEEEEVRRHRLSPPGGAYRPRPPESEATTRYDRPQVSEAPSRPQYGGRPQESEATTLRQQFQRQQEQYQRQQQQYARQQQQQQRYETPQPIETEPSIRGQRQQYTQQQHGQPPPYNPHQQQQQQAEPSKWAAPTPFRQQFEEHLYQQRENYYRAQSTATDGQSSKYPQSLDTPSSHRGGYDERQQQYARQQQAENAHPYRPAASQRPQQPDRNQFPNRSPNPSNDNPHRQPAHRPHQPERPQHQQQTRPQYQYPNRRPQQEANNGPDELALQLRAMKSLDDTSDSDPEDQARMVREAYRRAWMQRTGQGGYEGGDGEGYGDGEEEEEEEGESEEESVRLVL